MKQEIEKLIEKYKKERNFFAESAKHDKVAMKIDPIKYCLYAEIKVIVFDVVIKDLEKLLEENQEEVISFV